MSYGSSTCLKSVYSLVIFLRASSSLVNHSTWFALKSNDSIILFSYKDQGSGTHTALLCHVSKWLSTNPKFHISPTDTHANKVLLRTPRLYPLLLTHSTTISTLPMMANVACIVSWAVHAVTVTASPVRVLVVSQAVVGLWSGVGGGIHDEDDVSFSNNTVEFSITKKGWWDTLVMMDIVGNLVFSKECMSTRCYLWWLLRSEERKKEERGERLFYILLDICEGAYTWLFTTYSLHLQIDTQSLIHTMALKTSSLINLLHTSLSVELIRIDDIQNKDQLSDSTQLEVLYYTRGK